MEAFLTIESIEEENVETSTHLPPEEDLEEEHVLHTVSLTNLEDNVV